MCNSQEERPSLGQSHYSRFFIKWPWTAISSTEARQKQSDSFSSPPQKLQICRAAFEQRYVEHSQSWFWDTHSSYCTWYTAHHEVPSQIPLLHQPHISLKWNLGKILRKLEKPEKAEHCVSYLEEHGVGRESPNKTDCHKGHHFDYLQHPPTLKRRRRSIHFYNPSCWQFSDTCRYLKFKISFENEKEIQEELPIWC